MSDGFLKKIVAISVVLVVLPLIAAAQFSLPLLPSHELSIQITPTYPGPNEKVYISLALYSGDLNSAEITWYKNGETVLRGTGETRYSFTTGAAGEEVKIGIVVALLGGSTFTQSFTINPNNIDIIWEADSYTPPFYKGKALHSRQGSLKLVAVPNFVKNGQKISPSKLIYEWSNNNTVYQSQSGYGRDSLFLNGSILGRSEQITVKVRDPITNMTAQKSITIGPTDPEIVFYENNPYYGLIFDTAIAGSQDLSGEELSVLAVPYYFSKTDLNNLEYKWLLNGRTAGSLAGSRTAIFKRPEGESGSSRIALSVENFNRVLQFASGGFNISFGN